MARIKRLIDSAYVNDIAAQLDLERELFAGRLVPDECGEGIAAFLEKRAPRFT